MNENNFVSNLKNYAAIYRTQRNAMLSNGPNRAIWSTDEEILYLRSPRGDTRFGKIEFLERYLATIPKRARWGDIDPTAVTAEAHRLLAVVRGDIE